MPVAPAEFARQGHGTPPLERRAAGRLIGGVAGGIADHLGISAIAVRAAFVAAAFGGGLGVVLYAVFWIVLPVTHDDGSSRTSPLQYVGAIAAGIIALASSTWLSPFGDLFVPAAIGCVGAALLWRQAGAGQRERWRQMSRTSLTAATDDRWGQARVVAGTGLVVVGCAAVLASANLSAVGDGRPAVANPPGGVAQNTRPGGVRVGPDPTGEPSPRVPAQAPAHKAPHKNLSHFFWNQKTECKPKPHLPQEPFSVSITYQIEMILILGALLNACL